MALTSVDKMKIAKYLRTHPDVVSQIEKETETENLQDFFEIK